MYQPPFPIPPKDAPMSEKDACMDAYAKFIAGIRDPDVTSLDLFGYRVRGDAYVIQRQSPLDDLVFGLRGSDGFVTPKRQVFAYAPAAQVKNRNRISSLMTRPGSRRDLDFFTASLRQLVSDVVIHEYGHLALRDHYRSRGRPPGNPGIDEEHFARLAEFMYGTVPQSCWIDVAADYESGERYANILIHRFNEVIDCDMRIPGAAELRRGALHSLFMDFGIRQER
jgi:hypothetical protein